MSVVIRVWLSGAPAPFASYSTLVDEITLRKTLAMFNLVTAIPLRVALVSYLQSSHRWRRRAVWLVIVSNARG